MVVFTMVFQGTFAFSAAETISEKNLTEEQKNDLAFATLKFLSEYRDEIGKSSILIAFVSAGYTILKLGEANRLGLTLSRLGLAYVQNPFQYTVGGGMFAKVKAEKRLKVLKKRIPISFGIGFGSMAVSILFLFTPTEVAVGTMDAYYLETEEGRKKLVNMTEEEQKRAIRDYPGLGEGLTNIGLEILNAVHAAAYAAEEHPTERMELKAF